MLFYSCPQRVDDDNLPGQTGSKLDASLPFNIESSSDSESCVVVGNPGGPGPGFGGVGAAAAVVATPKKRRRLML